MFIEKFWMDGETLPYARSDTLTLNILLQRYEGAQANHGAWKLGLGWTHGRGADSRPNSDLRGL